MLKKLLLVLLLSCTVGIFYYSWLPDPKLASETYLPAWLLQWSNLHFNLRTAIPFIGFGFLLEMWGGISGQKKNTKEKVLRALFHIALAAVIVTLAELGQYFILNRHPDSMDILYGILGSVLGCLLFVLFTILIESNFTKNEK